MQTVEFQSRKRKERGHLVNLRGAQSATETSSGQIQLTAQFRVCVWCLLLWGRRGVWFWRIVCAGADGDLSGVKQGVHGRGGPGTGVSFLILLFFFSLGGWVLKQRARYSHGAESRASGVEVHLVFVRAGEERGGRGLSWTERKKRNYFLWFAIFPFIWSLRPRSPILVPVQVFFLFLLFQPVCVVR